MWVRSRARACSVSVTTMRTTTSSKSLVAIMLWKALPQPLKHESSACAFKAKRAQRRQSPRSGSRARVSQRSACLQRQQLHVRVRLLQLDAEATHNVAQQPARAGRIALCQPRVAGPMRSAPGQQRAQRCDVQLPRAWPRQQRRRLRRDAAAVARTRARLRSLRRPARARRRGPALSASPASPHPPAPCPGPPGGRRRS